MSLFPHLSRVRIWMLRVTMLIRMIYWMWLSDAENSLSIGSLVQKIWAAEKRHGRSVGRVAQLCENYHIQRKLARPSASLVTTPSKDLAHPQPTASNDWRQSGKTLPESSVISHRSIRLFTRGKCRKMAFMKFKSFLSLTPRITQRLFNPRTCGGLSQPRTGGGGWFQPPPPWDLENYATHREAVNGVR